MPQFEEDLSRLNFLAGAAAAAAAAASGQDAIAALVSPAAAATDVPAEVAVVAANADTWWEVYRTWHPAIQRFLGSYLGAILRSAEQASEESVAFLKQNNLYDTVQHLSRMRANGETIYPISAGYGQPPLTAEQVALATRIPETA